jgi:hypothetical protein
MRPDRSGRRARTACTSNPDAALIVPIAHPAPIPAPLAQPRTTARARRHRRHHLLASGHVLADRLCPRPDDRHAAAARLLHLTALGAQRLTASAANYAVTQPIIPAEKRRQHFGRSTLQHLEPATAGASARARRHSCRCPRSQIARRSPIYPAHATRPWSPAGVDGTD